MEIKAYLCSINELKTDEMDLIKEAKKRGYKTGTVINYFDYKENDTLGDGELAIDVNGRLIKYENKKENRNPNDFKTMMYDVIYDGEWTKIISEN